MAQSGPVQMPPRMSFAKVAAMPRPARTITPNSTKADSSSQQIAKTSPSPIQKPVVESAPNSQLSSETVAQLLDPTATIPLKELSLSEIAVASPTALQTSDNTDSYEEESQFSGSSLDKLHNFDTKSLTSVTTFAMDDKESIRPDDSASVRAADEDHSQTYLSRAHNFQKATNAATEKGKRGSAPSVILPGRYHQTLVNPPRFGTLPISPVLESVDPVVQLATTQNENSQPPGDLVSIPAPTPPDERLIQALSSAKDRMPLLQLEAKLLHFLATNTNGILELPPQTSYMRLLAHKLADYYDLNHLITEDGDSVRIFRTEPKVLPTSLAQLAASIQFSGTSLPTAAAIKIMRRKPNGRNRFNLSQPSPASSPGMVSMTASEDGADSCHEGGLTSPMDESPNKDKSKMSMEERLKQYDEARMRIFGQSSESNSGSCTVNEELSISISRASSSAGKRKSRKKQVRDDDFETRYDFENANVAINGGFPTAPRHLAMQNNYSDPSFIFPAELHDSTPRQHYSNVQHDMPYYAPQGFTTDPMGPYVNNDWQMQAMHNEWLAWQQHQQHFAYTQLSYAPYNTMDYSANNQWNGGEYAVYNDFDPNAASVPFVPQTQSQLRVSSSGTRAINLAEERHDTSAYHDNPRARIFNPQTQVFIPAKNVGRPGSRTSAKHRNHKSGRSSMSTSNNTSMSNASVMNHDTLKQRYGTPSSLPRKPPTPTDSRAASDNCSKTPTQSTVSVITNDTV